MAVLTELYTDITVELPPDTFSRPIRARGLTRALDGTGGLQKRLEQAIKLGNRMYVIDPAERLLKTFAMANSDPELLMHAQIHMARMDNARRADLAALKRDFLKDRQNLVAARSSCRNRHYRSLYRKISRLISRMNALGQVITNTYHRLTYPKSRRKFEKVMTQARLLYVQYREGPHSMDTMCWERCLAIEVD